MKNIVLLNLITLVIIISSCTPYVEKSTIGKSNEQLSIIIGQEAPLLDMNGTVVIRSVDGAKVNTFAPSKYTLTPGQRTLVVGLDHPEYRSYSQLLSVKLLPGKTYMMKSNITSVVESSMPPSTKPALIPGLVGPVTTRVWKPTIVDKLTGKIVSKNLTSQMDRTE